MKLTLSVLLKMVQLIGSEDLVTAVLDKIVEQVCIKVSSHGWFLQMENETIIQMHRLS